ncbi:MAG: type 4a pilus biogenesis protein PilO [Caldisericia bacterium]|nr:type 4a pilus biogenesis protein PilO [Caldisericia bacterium]
MKGAAQKYIVLIILLVLMGVFYYMYLLKPQIEKVKELNNKINEANIKLEELTNIKKNEAKIRELIDENYKDLELLRGVLPLGEDLPRLLTQIQQVEKEEGIKFDNINFVGGAQTQAGGIQSTRLMTREDYYEMKVTFSVTTTYDKFMKLLTRLENFPRILVIRKISVSSPRIMTKEVEALQTYNFEAYFMSAKEP